MSMAETIRDVKLRINGQVMLASAVTKDQVEFELWSKCVDRLLLNAIGLTQMDLPDWASYDTWNDGTDVYEAAQSCIEWAEEF